MRNKACCHRFRTMVSMCWRPGSTNQDYDATISTTWEWSLSAALTARWILFDFIMKLCLKRWQSSAFWARTIPRLFSCTVIATLSFTHKLAATTDWGDDQTPRHMVTKWLLQNPSFWPRYRIPPDKCRPLYGWRGKPDVPPQPWTGQVGDPWHQSVLWKSNCPGSWTALTLEHLQSTVSPWTLSTDWFVVGQQMAGSPAGTQGQL